MYVYDILIILDKCGIVVRVGIYCVMLLLDFFGVLVMVCVSFVMYNICVEVDVLIDGLIFCCEFFV